MIGNVTMTNKDGITKSAYDDFNLIIKHKVIHSPNPQLHKQAIVGMNGAIDLTEYATGDVKFEERQIDLDFRFLGRENERTAMVSRLMEFVHGQDIRYIFNDDLEFFYEGRMTENTPEVDGKKYDLSTSIICHPFKRDLESSAEEWLWDPFDFELGVINDLASLELPSNQYVGYLMIGSVEDYPVITSLYDVAIVTFADSPIQEQWYEETDIDIYTISKDTVALRNKDYYEKANDTYTQVTEIEYGDNPSSLGLYELDDVYKLSTDTQADSLKTYYVGGTGANVQVWYDVNPETAPQVTPMWTVNAGQTKKLYDCKILKGEHWFTFKAVNANGSVTVDYRGGML